jgi:PTH1 family peptidyl-tRNA hydrolase
VVGLANPGAEYDGTRHNVGAEVVERLAERHGAKLRKGKERARVDEVTVGGRRLALAIPLTYMNLSGGPVTALAQFYKVPPDQIVAVHDELDLPYGQVRAKIGGGEGGHNGLRSMSRSLSTKDYARVRFGIGRPPGRQDPADYVLSDFSAAERKELEFLVDRAADVTEAVVVRGVEWAQNAYHGT